jgi:hypothetical protein
MAPIVTWQAPIKSGIRTEDDEIRAAYNLPDTVSINDAMRASYRSGTPNTNMPSVQGTRGDLSAPLSSTGQASVNAWNAAMSSPPPQQEARPFFGSDPMLAMGGTLSTKSDSSKPLSDVSLRGDVAWRTAANPSGWKSSNSNTTTTTTNNQQSVDPMLQATYNQNLQNFLTGSAYDPYAQSAAEGNARSARNLRAGTAAQTAKLGLVGQGVADQIAGATTQQIMGQTLDTNLGIAKGRTEMQQDAMGEFRNNRGEIWNENREIRNEGRTDAERAFDWAMDYGSDADVIRAAAQRGVTLDPASVATYRNEQRMARQTAVTSGLETDFAGYAMAHPNQDWRGDQGATAKGAALFKAYTGKDADVNSPEFAAFMDKQWGAAQYEENPVDATVRGIKESKWYQGLPKDKMSAPPGYTGMTQDDVDILTSMTLFNGYTVAHNADGTISIVDPTGKAVTNPSSYKTSGPQTVDFTTTNTNGIVPGIDIPPVVNIKNAQSAVEYLSDGGYDTTEDRVTQYFNEKGAWPTNADDFKAWDKSTYDSQRIIDAFSDTGDGDISLLSREDLAAVSSVYAYETALEEIKKAGLDPTKLKDPGYLTMIASRFPSLVPSAQTVMNLDAKYQPLLGKVPSARNISVASEQIPSVSATDVIQRAKDISDPNAVTLPDGSSYSYSGSTPESGGQRTAMVLNKNYYQPADASNTYGKFTDAQASAMKSLAGKPIVINGKTYLVDKDTPIATQQKVGSVSFTTNGKSYTQDWYLDGINVTDPATGTSKVITFGGSGIMSGGSTKDLGKEALKDAAWEAVPLVGLVIGSVKTIRDATNPNIQYSTGTSDFSGVRVW